MNMLRKVVALLALVWVCQCTWVALAADAIPPEQFDKLHKMIKPQPGELRFQEIPWLLSVYDARKKAAEEGKPILIWSGSGGAPVGVC
jgi:hypothetical protein